MPAPRDARESIGVTVSSALPAAGDAWHGALHALGIEVQAICAFSFGSPIVGFEDRGVARRCGLGAVLVVVDDLSSPGGDRRALLISTPHVAGEAGPLEAAQRHLYAKWPVFQFEDQAYRAGERDFGPSNGDAGGSHGCEARIDLSMLQPAWLLSQRGVGCHRLTRDSLGAKLAAMATGAAGRKAKLGGADVWSQTVDELLRRTGAATVDGLRNHPRVRSTTTYRGHNGSGFVVFENRTNLTIERALTEGDTEIANVVGGPISVAHFVFRRLDGYEPPPGRVRPN